MKGLLKRVVSMIVVVIMATTTPITDFAPKEVNRNNVIKAATTSNYLSEIKIGMGETSKEAKKELEEEGYTILKDESGNLANLNDGAGSKSALKRGANDKVVYLGYKTTTKAQEAITDLAVMNMNGGDSIEEYEMLMNQQMESQIKPFVDRFIATLQEYRANCNKPKNSKNYKRANHVRKLLNKLTDDDTGGKPMGDLLLNKTKYEMGDKAYNALSDEEKKNHADILTLLMQANGQATITIETLLSKATDSSDDSWIDRLQETSLDDLKDQVKEEKPKLTTKADVLYELDKKYYNTALGLLKKWESFRKNIRTYEDKADDIVDAIEDTNDLVEDVKDIDLASADDDEMEEFIEANEDTTKQMIQMQIVGICTYLDTVNYEDDTLLEFFNQPYDSVSGTTNIRKLYPIVASLTEGQIAGLDFLAIEDLISIALTDENTYKDVVDETKDLQTASVYEGVDREIYEKGGVALTSDALRSRARDSQKEPDDYKMGTLQIVLWTATAACAIATVATAVVRQVMLKAVPSCARAYAHIWNNLGMLKSVRTELLGSMNGDIVYNTKVFEKMEVVSDRCKEITAAQKTGTSAAVNVPSKFTQYLSAGLAIVTFVMTVVSTVMTILDAQDYYDTEYIPIPRFMVDEADITTLDEDGKKVVLKNQTAYYKAVKCNRKEGDSDITKKNFEAMGDIADLKGDIGREWLALYAVKYEKGTPILADSLLYKKDDKTVPSGYSTGIHEFGSDAACDLNKKSYIFPDSAPSIKIFYKTEEKTAVQLAGTGSLFSGGSFALGGGMGFAIGALFIGILMKRKNKYNKR